MIDSGFKENIFKLLLWDNAKNEQPNKIKRYKYAYIFICTCKDYIKKNVSFISIKTNKIILLLLIREDRNWSLIYIYIYFFLNDQICFKENIFPMEQKKETWCLIFLCLDLKKERKKKEEIYNPLTQTFFNQISVSIFSQSSFLVSFLKTFLFHNLVWFLKRFTLFRISFNLILF